jgi:hypothetical protein
MPMQAHAGSDARPRVLERPVEPQWRPAVARPAQRRRDSSELDQPEIERDSSLPYEHAGPVVVASVWLAFYVFAVLHSFITAAN